MVWWKFLVGGKSRHERRPTENSHDSALPHAYSRQYENRNSSNSDVGPSVLEELAFLGSNVPKDCFEQHKVPSEETAPSDDLRVSPNERVRLNVGGQIHEFSRDILQRYPDSMLARMMQRRWQQKTIEKDSSTLSQEEHQADDDRIPFIDRNGQRFGYVLDLYRDGVVHLPVTVSSAALLMDLEYFGLDIPSGDEDSSIRVSSVVEATEIVAALDEDMETQLKMLDQSISEKKNEISKLEQKKAGVQIADTIYKRFYQSKNRKKGQSLRIDFNRNVVSGSRASDLHELVEKASKDMDFLSERLKSTYGIKLIKVHVEGNYYVKDFSFEVCNEA